MHEANKIVIEQNNFAQALLQNQNRAGKVAPFYFYLNHDSIKFIYAIIHCLMCFLIIECS